MARIGLIASFALLTLLAGGCADEPGGVVQFAITGAEEITADLQDRIVIDWDGENPWTRELECHLDADLTDSTWSLIAVDRSIGNGMGVELKILDYDGPGTYTRDRFQPESALSVEYEEPDTAIRTAMDVAGGGMCNITLEEGSKTGAFACANIPLIVGGLVTAEEVRLEGTFSCNELGDGDDQMGGGRWGRDERDEDTFRDDF